MPPYLVKVNPRVLKWARTSVATDVTAAANSLKVGTSSIEEWEEKESFISIARLRKLASFYKRPLAVFFLSEAPDYHPIPDDFRTIPTSKIEERGQSFSKKTLLAIRRAVRTQEYAAELGEYVKHSFRHKHRAITIDSDPEEEADKIREMLGISIEEQLAWDDNKNAFSEWTGLLENEGVLVLELKMEIKEARGFSLHGSQGKPHIIAINFGDEVNAKIFSIFHEYAHLLLNESGISSIDWDEVKFGRKINRVETYCNHFAGAFLLPRRVILDDLLVAKNKDSTEWEELILGKLSKKYKVSKEVVLRRLLILGLTDENFYRQKRKEWLEKLKKKPKGGGGGRDMSRETVRQNGKVFTSLVFQASANGKISSAEIVDYLGVKTKYIPEILNIVKSG